MDSRSSTGPFPFVAEANVKRAWEAGAVHEGHLGEIDRYRDLLRSHLIKCLLELGSAREVDLAGDAQDRALSVRVLRLDP